MATYTSRTITSTRREWIVPAAEPWGAFLGDVRAALNAAAAEYQRQHGLTESVSLADDALRFKVTDDEIVISFTVETEVKP
ncbi:MULTISPECIES: hypothetical protein [unclassified Streptomyces]|uniref:hypothetical protein n=1 Tax=unclassified Streptomyces TaxID=2593676 RepID=UPI0033E81589